MSRQENLTIDKATTPGRAYQVCTKCVMDTTDPDITFDENGVCNHCHEYDAAIKKHVITGEEGRLRLEEVVSHIRREGRNKEYDCIIGVSGGVDSTYVAYKVKELGLRPLAVHLDNGWDSELAVANIHKALKILNIDLHTHVIDWEEFKDLQLSLLKASTPDSEIPSDHAIISLMSIMARKSGIKYIIDGCNFKTESHLPLSWSQGHWDWGYIKNVHRRFGKVRLKTFPHMNLPAYVYFIIKQQSIHLLDYIDYNKTEAMKLLEKELCWQYYGGKHYESIYTRFYQGYILPRKFGYDKRKTHLSSLICSGEITRAVALEKLSKEDTYPLDLQEEDKTYVIKKLGLTENEFESIMNAPKKSYWDYPSYGHIMYGPLFKVARWIFRAFKN
jgi:N-acetyl sugar amidotransferase